MVQNMVYFGECFLNTCNECISCCSQMEGTANVNSMQLLGGVVHLFSILVHSLLLVLDII